MHRRFERAERTLSEKVETRKLEVLGGLSIVYLASTLFLASRKTLWNDELFTLHISQLPTVADIWSALSTGADQIPPFFYLVTRLSSSLFGLHDWSLRLPAVLGFWLMTLCVFRFVAMRSSAVYGFAAMLFPFVTRAYSYAYEARPYGLVLGFAALALLCWQSATEGRRRALTVSGLAIALAAAVASHYYAVFLLFPLAVGEAVRSLYRRRLDPAIWAAFGATAIPLIAFSPLIYRARLYATDFWAQAHWRSIPELYYALLTPAILPLSAALVVGMLYATIDANRLKRPQTSALVAVPPHEIAAAVGFTAIPGLAVVIAKLATGAVTDRYVLSAVIGFGILFAFAAVSEHRAMTGVILCLSLCAGFVVLEIRNLDDARASVAAQERAHEFLRLHDEAELPIVVSDLNTFTMLAHYAPRDLADRIVYLADPAASLRYLGHTTIDRGILDLKPWFRLRVEEYEPYIASRSRFLVYGNMGPWNWLVSDLKARNMRIALKARSDENVLLLVEGN